MAAAIVACNKETAIQTADQSAEKTDGIMITATLAPKDDATKAIAPVGTGLKTTWEEGETLAILYDGKKAEANIDSVDGDGKATISFTVEDGTTDGIDCQIIYPADAAKADKSGVKDAKDYLAAQKGVLSADLDVRVGEGTIQIETPGLTVTAQPAPQYAIFKFTTKNASSADITVSRLSVFIEGNEYVITPTSATSELTVALPPVETSTMVGFTATKSDDSKIYSFAKSVTFAAAKYYQSNLKMEIVEGVLDGAFSVSATKKVRFSRGNLQYNTSTSKYSFLENQYATVEANSTVDYSSSNVTLFGWGTGNNPTLTSTNNGDYSTFIDWGTATSTDLGTGWRTLTKDEWTYLFNDTGRSTLRYCKAQVDGKSGVVLFPDSYTHPSDGGTAPSSTNAANVAYTTNSWDATQWAAMETAGAVFLPAAGSRNGTTVYDAGGSGNYWSSTPHESSADSAYDLGFYDSGVNPASVSSRYYGRSVRLVQNQ